MTTVALTLGGLATGAFAGSTVAVGSAGPAGAEPITSCSTTSGVIVVVDFAHWGGTIERGCAATPTTSYDALQTAGFTTAGDEHDGPAFICRIDTKPTPTQTPCVDTPPASAYWSYWHANAGQTTWSYSESGPMTYKPPPGGVTAWVFGGTSVTGSSGGGRPSFSPTQVRATNTTAGGSAPTTTPSTSSPATTAPSGGGPAAGPGTTTTPVAGGPPSTAGPGGGASSTVPSGAPSRAGGGPSAADKAPTGADGSEPTTAPSSTAPRSTANGAGGQKSIRNQKKGTHPPTDPKIVDVVPATAAHRTSSGSPLPFVVGAIVVLVVAGTGGLVSWRRRRAAR